MLTQIFCYIVIINRKKDRAFCAVPEIFVCIGLIGNCVFRNALNTYLSAVYRADDRSLCVKAEHAGSVRFKIDHIAGALFNFCGYV